MKEKIGNVRKALIALQEELVAAGAPVPGDNFLGDPILAEPHLTPRAKTLYERTIGQLGDAELNLLKLYRIL